MKLVPTLTSYPPKKIAVYAGICRGGYGDIAANLEMALVLQRHYSDSEVVLITNENNHERLSHLLNRPLEKGSIVEYDSFTNGTQIRIHHPQDIYPEADVLFCFSLDEPSRLDSSILDVAPVRLFFNEYTECRWQDGFYSSTKDTVRLHINPGASTHGWYYDPAYTPEILDKKHLYEALAEIYGVELPPDKPIHLCFASYPSDAKIYMNAIRNYATQPIIITSHPSEADANDGCLYLDANQIPYDLFPSVITHSGILPKIRGNLSLTQAFLSGPFIYSESPGQDNNSNMKAFIKIVLQEGEKIIAPQRYDNFKSKIAICLGSSLGSDDFTKIFCGRKQDFIPCTYDYLENILPEAYCLAFNDSQFLEDYAATLNSLKEKLSIMPTIDGFLRYFTDCALTPSHFENTFSQGAPFNQTAQVIRDNNGSVNLTPGYAKSLWSLMNKPFVKCNEYEEWLGVIFLTEKIEEALVQPEAKSSDWYTNTQISQFPSLIKQFLAHPGRSQYGRREENGKLIAFAERMTTSVTSPTNAIGSNNLIYA